VAIGRAAKPGPPNGNGRFQLGAPRPADADDAARSLRVFAWYLPLSRIYFFTPVYFLYFMARFDMAEVLLLGSIYYSSVVVCELPSGYLSDRVGRLTALRLSAVAMSAAYALFLLAGDRFALFALAQALLGLGFASISGSDTAYHYDTVRAAGREADYAPREERLTRNGYWAGGIGAVAAGLVAQQDLAYAYGLCLVNSIGLLGLSFALREPRRDPDGYASAHPIAQARAIGRTLRSPHLAWLFAFGVLSVTLAHLPAEFAQPYLAAVLGDDVRDVGRTPLAAGLLVGLSTGVAGFAAARSLWLRETLGLARALWMAGFWQVLLMVAMAAIVHPVVALTLLTRSCLPAITRVILAAEVAPRLHASLRASYLSLDSLAGRLGYSVVLAGLAAVTGGGRAASPADLSLVLWVGAGLGGTALVALLATSRALEGRPRHSPGAGPARNEPGPGGPG